MFELNNKTELIRKHFSPIIKEGGLHFSIINSHQVQLRNNKCIIEFSTQRYYCDLQITFINTKNNKEYSIGEILQTLNLIGTKILSNEEGIKAQTIKDELENGLYCFSIIINKYCQNFLIGDFSIVEKES